ncbi:UDP-galactose transporter senju-like [Physella acuta]|uniref:UDP-galactose transporter senju-like n=1 Tax=Physella acuta TaxID=109671 RepID=UPI0027DB1F4A|nr:UDP-galactose transporter senju-like [Physella acuta]
MHRLLGNTVLIFIKPREFFLNLIRFPKNGKMGLISAELFPTKLSFVVFITYMGLFINQGILVTASKSKDNTYKYNIVTVVLLTETLKLVVAAILFVKDHSVVSLFEDLVKYKRVLCLYFIPAALYCLYNNLQFVNLSAYDPTTYYLLLQFRVVVTGVVFQVIFKKKLSCIQWASLLILTIGCIIKEVRHDVSSAQAKEVGPTSFMDYLDIHLLFIFFQVFSSCIAGVYNEFLLKDTGVDVHIMMANVFMYLNSIVCNICVLAFKGDLIQAFGYNEVMSIMQPNVLAIICNNAAIGIVTSLFLRSLNSILKTFASALELMFTAVLCWMIFGIPVDLYTILAIFIVSLATYLYAQHPVVNKARTDMEIEIKKDYSNVPNQGQQPLSPTHRHKTLQSV